MPRCYVPEKGGRLELFDEVVQSSLYSAEYLLCFGSYSGKTRVMGDPTMEALIVDFLAWLAQTDRSYEEVMEAWRTSCPKLPVWEEANDRGLVTRDRAHDRSIVRITQAGLAYLAEKGIVAKR